jgi:UDP-N-acetylmuramyl pentapeptide phosphotransferase/UDP-N-acetylglucosamine-1-phosphate transferase
MFSCAPFEGFALLLTLVFHVCRSACTRLGLVDRSGLHRVHLVPVPRMGGIAILGWEQGILC